MKAFLRWKIIIAQMKLFHVYTYIFIIERFNKLSKKGFKFIFEIIIKGLN